jgi:hypothetical protein
VKRPGLWNILFLTSVCLPGGLFAAVGNTGDFKLLTWTADVESRLESYASIALVEQERSVEARKLRGGPFELLLLSGTTETAPVLDRLQLAYEGNGAGFSLKRLGAERYVVYQQTMGGACIFCGSTDLYYLKGDKLQAVVQPGRETIGTIRDDGTVEVEHNDTDVMMGGYSECFDLKDGTLSYDRQKTTEAYEKYFKDLGIGSFDIDALKASTITAWAGPLELKAEKAVPWDPEAAKKSTAAPREPLNAVSVKRDESNSPSKFNMLLDIEGAGVADEIIADITGIEKKRKQPTSETVERRASALDLLLVRAYVLKGRQDLALKTLTPDLTMPEGWHGGKETWPQHLEARDKDAKRIIAIELLREDRLEEAKRIYDQIGDSGTSKVVAERLIGKQ